MAYGQNYLNHTGLENLRDYAHAPKVFRSNGYENAPRYKFLFHVYFRINTEQIPALRSIYSYNETSTIGLLVKSIQLPQFQIATDTLNQYNRKRVVQKKIDYQPITAEFHDDGGDLIRTLWYNYYSYYYKDPNQPYDNTPSTNGTNGVSSSQSAGFSYNSRDIYQNERKINDWGYVGESYSDGTGGSSDPGGKPAFFKDISIYGFDQHRYVQYVLINPVIQQWNHDQYDYAQGDGVMKNAMTIAYETVKYYSGGIGEVRPDTNVQGFADPAYYDQGPSPLSKPNGQSSIVGQGSQLDQGIGTRQDLQAQGPMGQVGAVQTPNTFYNVNPTDNPRTVPNVPVYVSPGLQSTLRTANPAEARLTPNGGPRNVFFPTPSKQPQSLVKQVATPLAAGVLNSVLNRPLE